VVTLSDTWSSTDNAPHTLDLLYDDTVGTKSTTARGYEFPGENGLTTHVAGDSVPAASVSPDSILVHTNLAAPDGDPAEAFGAISFSRAPSGFKFVPKPPTPPTPSSPSYELAEHQVLQIPTGGSTTLRYIYSVASTASDVSALALAAQDRFAPLALAISSPASGTTVSVPGVTLSGTTSAGSGIKSLIVGGQAISVASDGSWSAQVPLSPGANTITAVATDGAGATAQAQVTVVYQPPAPPVVAKCHVPRVKGMKLRAAEKALRHAHCRVGKVKHVSSRKLARGRVTSTTPRAGRRLPAASKIELFVSKGR
jgi:glucodextranase-like protein/PASTA domain-containing protein